MRTRKNQSGFTLLEMIVVIGLMAIGMILIYTMMANSAERERETVAASHMRRIVDAADRYISDNYAALIATADATTPAILTPATLRSAQYLGNQVGDLNPYGQTYEIRVLEPTAGRLQALIITNGGQGVPEGSLRRIARQIGPEGGYVSSSGNTTVTGAYGGWSTSLSSYGSANGAGRIGASLFFRDGQQVSDFIYRSSVTGRPELNTMNAPLNMGNNNLTNANGVTANGAIQGATVTATGRVYANEYIQIAGVVSIGAGCGPNGTLGREADGRLASCVAGVWRRAGF